MTSTKGRKWPRGPRHLSLALLLGLAISSSVAINLSQATQAALEQPDYNSDLELQLQDLPQDQQRLLPAASAGFVSTYAGSDTCLISINRTTTTTTTTTTIGGPTYGPYFGGGPTWAAYGPQSRQQVCITERDVARALEEARQQVGVAPGSTNEALTQASSDSPRPLEIIKLANVVAQATRLLAARFQLQPEEILFELPNLDANRSPSLANTCPLFLRSQPPGRCLADELTDKRFRSLSGFCNNPREPAWGSARSAMVRFLAPDYQDSISLPRVARDGSPLPSPRVVSFVVHQDPPECDQRHSLLGVVWGQFINHDINLGVRITEEDERLRELDCCKSPGGGDASSSSSSSSPTQATTRHPDCFPIEIPKGDPFYGYFKQKCMNFVRLAAALQPGCSMGPVQAMNRHSSYLDGSSIYGSSASTLKRLRTFAGGQLRSQPVGMPALVPPPPPQGLADYDYPSSGVPSVGGGLAGAGSVGFASLAQNPLGTPLFKDLLPANTAAPDLGCERRGRPRDLFCFDAGDSRANEQIQLASLHTIFMREHNRLAGGLAALNPHWDDERLFQEARAIVVAELQHITYAEFLPLVVGKEHLLEFGLELEPRGHFFAGYDPKLNAAVRLEFQSAAFRFGHSLVPGHVDRYNKFHQVIESVRLSKLLKQPFDLYFPGVLDTYLLGMLDQRSGRMDSTLTTELANHLFEKPGNFFGMDLAAINIQRAREMGVRGYNSYREYCGLARARNFDDLVGVFNNKTLLRVMQLYKHVDDIDLFTGGLAERPLSGLGDTYSRGPPTSGLVGPTFACLIGKQFELLRRADRFWYENANGHFRLEQLDEIRRSASSARLLCDNSDDLEDVQASAMLVPEARSNPRGACASLPALDLSKWREQQPVLSVSEPPPLAATGQTTPQTVALNLNQDDYVDQSGYGQQVAAGASSPVEMPLDYEPIYGAERDALASSAVLNVGQTPNIAHEGMRQGLSQFVNHLVEVTNFRPDSILADAGAYLGKARRSS